MPLHRHSLRLRPPGRRHLQPASPPPPLCPARVAESHGNKSNLLCNDACFMGSLSCRRACETTCLILRGALVGGGRIEPSGGALPLGKVCLAHSLPFVYIASKGKNRKNLDPPSIPIPTRAGQSRLSLRIGRSARHSKQETRNSHRSGQVTSAILQCRACFIKRMQHALLAWHNDRVLA